MSGLGDRPAGPDTGHQTPDTVFSLIPECLHGIPAAKHANLKRLRRIEGQVRGLQKMVEEDRYCPDIMIQISAVHEALRTVGRALMSNHLRHCATHALTEGSPDEADRTYRELLDLIYTHAR